MIDASRFRRQIRLANELRMPICIHAREADQEVMDILKEEAEKAKVDLTDEEYQQSLPLIRTQLKALMARDLWDISEYYQVINTANESVKQALRVLNNDYDRILSLK